MVFMNPILFKIGSIVVGWYGVIMALMFLIGYFITLKLAPSKNIKRRDIEDFFLFLIPISLIGARIFEVLFYESNYYLSNPVKILSIWDGGLSIHGALVFSIIFGIYFAKKRNINFYDLADIFVIPLSFGLIFGRFANFINQELYGKVTNVPWAVNFEGIKGKRHPTQIYESIKNLFIFITLLILYKTKDIERGFIFWTFVFLYSVLRFVIEFWKDFPSIYFGMNMGQLLTLPFLIISGVMLLRDFKKRL